MGGGAASHAKGGSRAASGGRAGFMLSELKRAFEIGFLILRAVMIIRHGS